MATKSLDNTAPYDRHNPETTWCTGHTGGSLGSTSYGSFVGLVLYKPATKEGAVAHFPGGLGKPQFANTVTADADDILDDVLGVVVQGNWLLWVFGGESLSVNSQHESSAIPQTKSLIDLVRGRARGRLGGNRMAGMEPEMGANSYVGHKGVNLSLADGKITWEEPRGSTPKVLHAKRLSGNF
jgi:hypothetical protein